MKYKLRYKFISFLSLAFLALVLLASCNHTKVNSSINGKEIYASSGNYSITNAELWNELKWNSYDTLVEKIDEAIFKNEMATAKEAIDYATGASTNTELTQAELKRYIDYLELLALTEVYSLSDIEDLKTLTANEISVKTQTFVDNLYLDEGKSVSASSFEYDNIITKAKTLFAGTKYEETYYMYDFYERYQLTLAKRIFAFGELADDIEDYDDDADDEDELYYTDEDIIQYQKENYQYSADRQALIIRFTNEDEIKSTLKAFGIKVYNDTFYYIPANGKTVVEYSEYYDDFSIESLYNSSYCVNLNAIGGDSLIFELYLQIYNFIYTYRDALPTQINILNTTTNRRDITEAIIAEFKNSTVDPADVVSGWDQDKKDILNKTQDDLDDIDKDFKLYVSKTLKVNPDKSEGETRYSTAGKSYNDYSYMVFKVSEDELNDWYYLCDEDEFDATNPTIDTSDEKVAAYKQELIEEMMWNEVNDSFVDSKYKIAKEDAKVYIYDNDIEILYSSNKSNYSKTHKDAPTKDTLITVRYKKKSTNISVIDVFNELEVKSGVTTAVDLLSKKAIKDTEQYKETNEDRSDYKTTIELLLAYFANGSLSGYDSSLGKYNFLKLYFHTTDIDKIIDDTYRVNAASAKILTDYANNDSFYQLVQTYAASAYAKSFSVDAQNLLVYVDMDEDGKADEDFDWNTVDKNSSQTYKELAIELINKFITRMENSVDASTTLSTLAEEFKACQRFTNGIDTWYGSNTEYDPTEVESRWAKYKRAGLYISDTTYSGVGISSIESSTDSSIPSTIVKNRLKELYATVALFDTYPGTYVDDEAYKSGEGFMDKNGYSLLVVTSFAKRSSAEFDSKDDANGRFTNIFIEYDDVCKTISDIYNSEASQATINQITLFIYEYLNYSTSEFFPSSVQSYITDFIMPVYERYTASASQRELLLAKMLSGASNISFTDVKNSARLSEVMSINRRIADNYLENDDDANLFTDWWDAIINLEGGAH